MKRCTVEHVNFAT